MNTSVRPPDVRRAPRSLFLALLLALPGAAGAGHQQPRAAIGPADAASQRDAFAESVDEIGRDALAAGVAQMFVAVDVEGERILSRGFAAARSGAAPGGDTPFHAAPLLSTFLSVAALALAEEDRLELEASLAEHLPDLPYGDLGVRVDHLLAHTSGIPGYGDLLRAARRRSPEDDRGRILAWLRSGPLESAPGTCASYSNTNDLLLGLVLERVTGKSVHAQLAAAVFAPAGMEDTELGQPPRASSSAPVEQEFAGELEDQGGAAGPFDAERLTSTAHDLLRFQRALVERRLLPADALELRSTPPRLADGSATGFGRGVSLTGLGGQPCHSAGGGAAGQRVRLAYYPALDTTVVVWASGERAPVQQISARVARALFDLATPVVRDLPTTAELRARHEGDYYVGCTSYVVVGEEEHLVLYPPDGSRRVLLHQGEESFVDRDDPDVRLDFEIEDGKVAAFTLTEHGVSTRARRFY